MCARGCVKAPCRAHARIKLPVRSGGTRALHMWTRALTHSSTGAHHTSQFLYIISFFYSISLYLYISSSPFSFERTSKIDKARRELRYSITLATDAADKAVKQPPDDAKYSPTSCASTRLYFN